MNYDVLSLAHHNGNPRNSEGAFLTLNDGRVIFVYTRYRGDSFHDHAAADLALRESSDGGRTWSSEDRIIFRHSGGEGNIMSVSLLRLSNGRIFINYGKKFPSPDGSMNCVIMGSFSDDEGASWSEPEVLVHTAGYWCLTNDRTVQLSDGRIVIPLSDAYGSKKVCFYISDDQGEKWSSINDAIALTDQPPELSGCEEPGIVELSDGRLWCWIRTSTGYQYGAYSSDRGISWSEAQAMKEFRSPRSPMSVKRNPASGRLVAVWNDHNDRWDKPVPVYTRPGWGDVPTAGRHPLVLAESSDDGQTWQRHLRLESDTRRGYCYIAMHFTEDALLLGYCCGGAGEGEIMLQDLKIRRIEMDGNGNFIP